MVGGDRFKLLSHCVARVTACVGPSKPYLSRLQLDRALFDYNFYTCAWAMRVLGLRGSGEHVFVPALPSNGD